MRSTKKNKKTIHIFIKQKLKSRDDDSFCLDYSFKFLLSIVSKKKYSTILYAHPNFFDQVQCISPKYRSRYCTVLIKITKSNTVFIHTVPPVFSLQALLLHDVVYNT